MNEKEFGYDSIMADITPGLQKTFKNKRKIKIYQWGGDNKADMLTPGMIGIYALISLEPKKETLIYLITI